MGPLSPGSETTPRLILATRNKDKLRELRNLLRGHLPDLDVDTQVIDAEQAHAPEVSETGVTFAENSWLKAFAVAQATGIPTIADDSGLTVDVLGGAPGILSARWCGRHGDDAANLQLLLAQLSDVPDDQRGAAFVCAATLAVPGSNGTISRKVRHGRLAGVLLRGPHGNDGFGYDPIFRPTGVHLSCAELTPEQKSAISHRGQAFRALLPSIVEALTTPKNQP